MRPNPLSIDPLRRLAAALALAAGLAALALALGAPAPAQARAHAAGCRHAPAARRGSHRHACTRASHRSKPAGVRHVKKRPRPPRGRTKVALSSNSLAASTSPGDIAATCEDGSDPLRVGDEVFECEDGSDPRCEAGLALTLSNDGSTLVCSAVLQTAPGAGEGGCQDASSPSCPTEPPPPACSEGTASAGGDSPPSCEEPDEPACEAGPGDARPGEELPPACGSPGGEGDELAPVPRQAPAGPRSHVASAS